MLCHLCSSFSILFKLHQELWRPRLGQNIKINKEFSIGKLRCFKGGLWNYGSIERGHWQVSLTWLISITSVSTSLRTMQLLVSWHDPTFSEMSSVMMWKDGLIRNKQSTWKYHLKHHWTSLNILARVNTVVLALPGYVFWHEKPLDLATGNLRCMLVNFGGWSGYG